MIPVGYSDGTYNIVNCKFPLLTLSSDDYAHKHVILGQLLTNSENEESYTFLLDSFEIVVKKIFDKEVIFNYAKHDCAEYIENAFMRKYENYNLK